LQIEGQVEFWQKGGEKEEKRGKEQAKRDYIHSKAPIRYTLRLAWNLGSKEKSL